MKEGVQIATSKPTDAPVTPKAVGGRRCRFQDETKTREETLRATPQEEPMPVDETDKTDMELPSESELVMVDDCILEQQQQQLDLPTTIPLVADRPSEELHLRLDDAEAIDAAGYTHWT